MNKKLESLSEDTSLDTPAFVFSNRKIAEALKRLGELSDRVECKLLYSLKALALREALTEIVNGVEGFAASSLFEATLAREIIRGNGAVHITSPGLRPDEIELIAGVCDYIVFNSVSQWTRLRNRAGGASCGIRLNPGLSFVGDMRYAPCRPNSKLGVPMPQLRRLLEGESNVLDGIEGLHFHTNCDSHSFEPLLQTVRRIRQNLPSFLSKLKWLNLGGGYLFGESDDFAPFEEAVNLLKREYKMDVFIEPGAAIVREAGTVVSSVLDIFDSGDKLVAVLDTTVNHMPEVFEYQYRPAVANECDGGPYRYVLAGCTCLAGDLFGEYAFAHPLTVGSHIMFLDQGAYTLSKAHTFNGVSLPTIYSLTADSRLEKRTAAQEPHPSGKGTYSYAIGRTRN